MAYETELRREADRYSDLCTQAAQRAYLIFESEARTGVAVAAIKAMRGMTARDVCNVIEALHTTMQVQRWSSHDEADTAAEYLMDSHHIAERIAECEESGVEGQQQ